MTAAAIATLLRLRWASVFDKAPAEVSPDVDEILARFQESGLIVWQADSSAELLEANP